MGNRTIVKNRKAFFEYKILDVYSAGIQLKGSEVKSIRNSKVSLNESYCYINNNEVFIKSMHIAEYSKGHTDFNHNPLRDKKLLLKKKEITKLNDAISQKGLTIIPLELFLNEKGLIKVEIGLAKGKHLYDKKETIKLRDLYRVLKQNI